MEKRNLTTKDAGIAFIMAFLLAQVTSVIGAVVTELILQACGKTSSQISAFFDTAPGYLLQAIFMNTAFVLIFAWYYKKHLHKSEVLQHPNTKTYKYLGICVAIGVSSLFLLSGILNYFQLFIDKLGVESSTLSYELDSPINYIISLISLALIPAICEELIFRGVLVNALKQKGATFAIVLSSIMFAIFHFSPSQLIYPICFGLILSIVYLRTHNIIFPIILHFINNALSLSIQYFSNSSGEFVHSSAMLMYAIITFAIWISIIIWLFKDFRRNQHESDNTQSFILVNTTPVEDKHINYNEKLNNWFLYGSIAIMLCLYILLL